MVVVRGYRQREGVERKRGRGGAALRLRLRVRGGGGKACGREIRRQKRKEKDGVNDRGKVIAD